MNYKKTVAYTLDEESGDYVKSYPETHVGAIFYTDNEDTTLEEKLTQLSGIPFSFISTNWTLISSPDTDYIEGVTLYELTVTHTLNTTVIKNYYCYNTSNENMYCIVDAVDATHVKVISSEAFSGTIVLS